MTTPNVFTPLRNLASKAGIVNWEGYQNLLHQYAKKDELDKGLEKLFNEISRKASLLDSDEIWEHMHQLVKIAAQEHEEIKSAYNETVAAEASILRKKAALNKLFNDPGFRLFWAEKLAPALEKKDYSIQEQLELLDKARLQELADNLANASSQAVYSLDVRWLMTLFMNITFNLVDCLRIQMGLGALDNVLPGHKDDQRPKFIPMAGPK